MHLDKAIEIQSDSVYKGVTTYNQDYKDAQKLGIEAMLFLKALRNNYKPDRFKLLPGETAE